MTIFAHSNPLDPSTNGWESLHQHLSEVGHLSGGYAADFGWEHIGRIAGLLHDIGKCSAQYQQYIRQPPGATGAKGPDHSTAGAREAAELYGPFGRMIAFAIAGHHGGLMNARTSEAGARALNERLPPTNTIEDYSGWQGHVFDLPDAKDIAHLAPPSSHPAYPGFEMFFRIRMLFSCLVDADSIATERFYTPDLPRGGTIARHHLERLQVFLAGKRKADTAVNRLRSEILDHAVDKAALKPGLFTLTVPTGGGKTLTSLNFALEHALRHGKKRIIYIIPFTSIIEQTATVFRDALGTPDDILEHHSNFDWDQRGKEGVDTDGEGAAGLAKLQRDAENWDAPIIVTTAVQFFESLFARRRNPARKLHNLADSVIIMDEAQTMPVPLLRPCMAAIDELARNYGASIVLCTATQPALRQFDKALPPLPDGALSGFAIGEDRELAPRPKDLYKKLKRVDVEWRQGETDDDTIAARFAEAPQMLCIVNSRAHARELFEQIAEMDGARHLTTLMCARHRRTVLAGIRDDLLNKRPVRLIATSLIEAGVDVDFPEVWRAATGLDSIAQAAGRCNREGRLDGQGCTVVFEAAGRKNPPVIEAFWQAGRSALRFAQTNSLDPLGLESVQHYFNELYFQKGNDALDSATFEGKRYAILDAIRDTRRGFDFPFATISQAFRMIDDVMEPVLIPYDAEAERIMDALASAPLPPVGTLRKLQQYTVSIPAKARGAMLATGAVQAIKPEAYGDRFLRLASPTLYSEALGLRLDDPTWRSSESNIFS